MYVYVRMYLTSVDSMYATATDVGLALPSAKRPTVICLVVRRYSTSMRCIAIRQRRRWNQPLYMLGTCIGLSASRLPSSSACKSYPSRWWAAAKLFCIFVCRAFIRQTGAPGASK